MRTILLVIVFSFPVLAFSQEAAVSYPFYPRTFNPMYIQGGSLQPTGSNTVFDEKKMDIGVSLGTSFSTNFNKGFAFTTYAQPEIRYKLSKRFRVRGGLLITNSEYGNTLVYSPAGINSYSGNITQGMFYVSGDYVISPKLILSGTAYKEFSIDHGNADKMFSPAYDGKGLMMNLRIAPSENVFIDIGAEYYQGNNPYRSGLYNPYRTNPFMW